MNFFKKYWPYLLIAVIVLGIVAWYIWKKQQVANAAATDDGSDDGGGDDGGDYGYGIESIPPLVLSNNSAVAEQQGAAFIAKGLPTATGSSVLTGQQTTGTITTGTLSAGSLTKSASPVTSTIKFNTSPTTQQILNNMPNLTAKQALGTTQKTQIG